MCTGSNHSPHANIGHGPEAGRKENTRRRRSVILNGDKTRWLSMWWQIIADLGYSLPVLQILQIEWHVEVTQVQFTFLIVIIILR